jgi:xanthine/CO dehydrogenase XdhC/CoxF family maturation factor
VCPIGDRGVDDKRPEVIAALVAAELVEVFAKARGNADSGAGAP